MNTTLILGLVILLGSGLAWALHKRSVRHLTPILRRLAKEENGVIKSYPFVMPKLLYARSGVDVEVSTGIDGRSTEYTYVLFDGVPAHGFEFRIHPRSLLTVASEWTGFKHPAGAELGKLKEWFDIKTNDDELMQAILDPSIQGDLLAWSEGGMNRIADVRNYDGKLIYAVTGKLGDYEAFRLLLDSAGRFVDHFTSVMAKQPHA